ncbi:MAG: hypothetical protein D3924_12785 [Candidatus Electrothrix sp. AR4]|nr:hypothetical protein [Candidatus Electrothrix sp. AR4]
MSILYEKYNNKYFEWSSGSTPLLTDITNNGRKQIISVKCSFGNNPQKHYALFDTGAEWTVVPKSIVDDAPDIFFSLEIPISLTSRFGKHNGVQHDCDLCILADSGEDLIVESGVLVIPDWPGPVVLGFKHLLNKVRWACDPTIERDGRLFFGLAE